MSAELADHFDVVIESATRVLVEREPGMRIFVGIDDIANGPEIPATGDIDQSSWIPLNRPLAQLPSFDAGPISR